MREHSPYGDQTQFINYPDYNSKKPHLDYNRLYVYCDFIKPGKHQYLVQHEAKLVEPEPIKEVIVEKNPLLARKNLKTSLVEEHEEPKFVPHVTKIKMMSYH